MHGDHQLIGRRVEVHAGKSVRPGAKHQQAQAAGNPGGPYKFVILQKGFGHLTALYYCATHEICTARLSEYESESGSNPER